MIFFFCLQGVQVDRMESDFLDEEVRSSPSCKLQVESEEFCVMLRQQKYLHNVTEHALKKNQPLIILNLMHEKAPFLMTEDLSGTEKLEQMCLQALCICPFPGGPSIEVSVNDDMEDVDPEACLSNNKGSNTQVATVTTIMGADLPKIVSCACKLSSDAFLCFILYHCNINIQS